MGFTCTFCDEEIRPGQTGTMKLITGWVEERGAAGGAHQVAFPSAPQAFAHKACLRYSGATPDNQMALF